MNTLLALTTFLGVIICITAEPPECPDLATKEALKKYKVNKELTPLLKGNTYVDIWRRKGTTKYIDCSMTKFTASDNHLISTMHSVQHGGTIYIIEDKMTENKGESSFNSYGEFTPPGGETSIFDEYIHVFFADEFAWGYFSCDLNNGHLRLAVAVNKEKENDKEALESTKKAETIMNALKDFMPDEMTKLERKRCPENI